MQLEELGVESTIRQEELNRAAESLERERAAVDQQSVKIDEWQQELNAREAELADCLRQLVQDREGVVTQREELDTEAARLEYVRVEAESLRAVTDNVNSSKGDRDPASWLPPYRASTCTYLVGWVGVKLRWGLSVDAAEKSAISNAWSARGCADRQNPPRVEVRIAP